MSGKNLGETKLSFAIIPLEFSDLDAVYSLDQVCFPGDVAFPRHLFAFLLKSPDCLGLCIKDQGRLAGFIIVQAINFQKAQLITLDIDPLCRRRGIGTMLLESAHNFLKKRGFQTILLEVAVNNDPALKLYKKLGYEYIITKKRYYPDGTDALQMKKTLKEGPPPPPVHGNQPF
jgi:[ribosomal protein S18]-alanine N-acetyltransferase